MLEQLVLGGRGGPRDGRRNAAAGLGDLLVAGAGAAHRMLVGARAAEDQVRVAVDQAGRDPGAPERIDVLRAKAGELGALADADDLAVGDADRAVLDDAERVARARLQGRDIAVDEQPVPHAPWALGERVASGQSVGSWPNVSDLLVSAASRAPVGLVGAPLAAGSVTPGGCDQAPALLRQTLKRIGRYDVETGRELATAIADRGDVEIAGLSIEEATPIISDAVAASAGAMR